MICIHSTGLVSITYQALAHARVARHSIECFMKMQLPSSLEHVFICTTFGPPNCIDHKTYASGKQLYKSGCAGRRKSFIANGAKGSSECQRKTTALVANATNGFSERQRKWFTLLCAWSNTTAKQPPSLPLKEIPPNFHPKSEIMYEYQKSRFSLYWFISPALPSPNTAVIYMI